MPKKEIPFWVVNDVETSGPRVVMHSLLSWGACTVEDRPMTMQQRLDEKRIFYAEFKPTTREFVRANMSVGCAGMHCLRPFAGDPRYDPKSEAFDPRLVLEVLDREGETPAQVMSRFQAWLKVIQPRDSTLVGVFDTVLFDAPFLQLMFTQAGVPCPYGHTGFDLKSAYRGYARNLRGQLKELDVPDERATAHCALDDAAHLAEIARQLFFNRIGIRH